MALCALSGLATGVHPPGPRGRSGPWTFELAGLSVSMRLPVTASFDEGDLIVVVGRRHDDQLAALALRNETTGARYVRSSFVHCLAGGVAVGAGIPLFVMDELPWAVAAVTAGLVGLGLGLANAVAGARLDATPAESPAPDSDEQAPQRGTARWV